MLTEQQKFRVKLIKVILWGISVVVLYTALYLKAEELLAWTSQGKWTFIGVMIIAFVFSIAHGNFTSQFWDLLGVKPKPYKGKN